MADQDDSSTPSGPKRPVNVGGELLADRIMPHIKKILVMFILVAVAVSVILIIRWRGHAKQEIATEKLAQVMLVAQRPVGPEPVSFPPAPESKEPRFATAKDRAETVLATADKVGAETTPYYRAGLLLDAGRVDEAIAEYRSGQTAQGIDGVLAREGLGIALETKAGTETDAAARQKLLEEALAAFVAMQPDEAGPRRAYALYHQGRLQLTLGKRAEATSLFDKAKELGASTELPELIERRLAAL